MVFAFKTIRSVALAFAYLDKKAMFLLYQAVDEHLLIKLPKLSEVEKHGRPELSSRELIM